MTLAKRPLVTRLYSVSLKNLDITLRKNHLHWFGHQGSTIDLKGVYVSAYVFKNLGVRHVQDKNYKKLKNH